MCAIFSVPQEHQTKLFLIINIMKRQGNYPALSRKESKNAPSSAPGVCQGKSSNGKFPVGGGVTSVSHHSRVPVSSNSSVASPIKGCAIVSSPSKMSKDVPTIVSPSHHSRVSASSNSSVPSPIKGRAIVSNPSGLKQGVPTIVSPTKSDRSSGAVPSQASVLTLSAASPKKNFQARSAVTPSKSVHPLSSSNASRLHCASINWLSRSLVHAEILK